MQGRILTKAEIDDIQETMSSDMGPTDVYLMAVVPKLIATVQAMREERDEARLAATKLSLKYGDFGMLLEEAADYADHAPGCSGWVWEDGKQVYGCKCGFNEWREKVKKLLG